MTSSSLYCSTCGAAQQAQARYCFACGESLDALARETLLRQRYRIVGLVGQGGFGAVYQAQDTQFADRLVAIKEINLRNLEPQQVAEATDAFNRELRLLSGLAHPNLPRIYDHFTDSEHWYLVMDFIHGETLEQYLEKREEERRYPFSRRDSSDRMPLGLPVREVLEIGMQLCEVLDYLHTREPPIIFRDLKPANVMRTASGHLYLIDFGIARQFKPGQIRDTSPLGSPGYAAPEQYGRAQTTPQADIYSLGALLHQLVTGNDPTQTPFRFVPLPQQGQTMPERLQSLLLQMLEMDVNKRPTSIVAVQQELERIAAALQPAVLPSVGTILATYRGHSRLVLAVAWSPDGRYIASGSFDGTMQVWSPIGDVTSSTFTYRNSTRPYAWVWTLAWNPVRGTGYLSPREGALPGGQVMPDGTYIASGSDDKTVQVWQVADRTATTFKHVLTYRGHTNWVSAVAWSPDGKRIASGSDDRTVHVWDMDNHVGVYRGHSRWVNTLAWSPDGKYIASGGNDGTVRVWDTVTLDTVLIYRGHAFGVNALAWSPHGTRIASCSGDNAVRVWDVATGNTDLIYHGHTGCVNAVAWSPDGTRIASAGKDKTVQVWDATGGDGVTIRGNSKFTYRGHAGWVYALAWSPDGTRIASGGNDKTVQVWQAM